MALALAAVLAVLDAPGLQIDWQAPAACPQGEALQARVASLVGAAAERTDLAVTGRVAVEGETWTLVLELVRQDSREARTLRDRACAGLVEAAAVVIAVAIDPRASGFPAADPEDRGIVPEAPAAVVEPAVPEDRSGPGVATPPETRAPEGQAEAQALRGEPPETRAPRVEARGAEVVKEPAARARRIALSVKLGGGVGFARLLPGVHGVVDLGLAVGGSGWRVEASGLFVPPVRGASEVAGIGGVFRVGAGEVRGCGVPALRGGRLGFPLCAGLQVGAMHGQGSGTGLERTQEARSLWLATRFGPALRWRPRDGRVALWLGVDAIVALTRPEFRTAGMVTVHATRRFGGQVGLGVEVRLR